MEGAPQDANGGPAQAPETPADPPAAPETAPEMPKPDGDNPEAKPTPNGDSSAPVAAPTPMYSEVQQAAQAAAGGGDGSASQAPAPPVANSPYMERYNEYWQTVKENPDDFQSWTYLISTAEQMDDINCLREVFDAFLVEYPLCYGYWKKYADAEHRHGNDERAVEVYQRGVQSIPYSVDLWGHFCSFVQNLPETPEEKTRSLFEQGVAYVATDYLGHGLWDKYLQFEIRNSNHSGVAHIYSRILACPLRDLSRYYQSLQEFASQHLLSEMLGQEERDSVRAEVEKKKKENLVEAAPQDPTASDVPPPTAGEPKDESMTQGADVKEDEKDAKADGDAAPEAASLAKKDKDGSVPEPEDMSHDGAVAEEPGHGTDPMNVEEPESRKEGTGVPEAGDMDVEMEPAPPGADAATKVEVTDDDVLAAWLESLEQVYEGSKRELARRKPFEDCIKRPYFHVKPLDSTQLTNWNKYLDYIEKNGDHVAAVTLYERCLIACACYPEFWKRYVRYLEANDLKLARGALQRATLVYCKRKADMHLFSAHFEERHGNIDEARKVFKHVQTLIAPRLLSMIVQFANFERRQGNTDTACTILTENIEEEKSKEGSKIYNFLCLHSAHFLNMVVKDKLRARAVLDAALAHRPGAKALWQGAIQLEEGICDDDSVSRTLDLYDRCTSPPEDGAEALSEKDREELSLQCVEFADLRCDANVRAAIERRHTERFPFPVASGDTKKRSASEQGSVPASKVHRTGMEGSAYGAGQLAMTSAVTPGTVGAMVPSPAAAQPHMYYGQQMATGQMTTNQQYNQYAQYYSQYQGYNYTGYGY